MLLLILFRKSPYQPRANFHQLARMTAELTVGSGHCIVSAYERDFVMQNQPELPTALERTLFLHPSEEQTSLLLLLLPC